MWNVRASAERMARNFPMQGAQADILKMAMLKVSDYCNQFGEEMRMILTVHDEIVFEVKEQLVDQLCRKVPDLMTSVCSLAVPLKVGVKVGKNWRDMKEYNQE
jgi:DNA polymerase-1